MKNVIKCVNKDCGYMEPTSGREYMYKERAAIDQGHMIFCSICGCQTVLIDDK